MQASATQADASHLEIETPTALDPDVRAFVASHRDALARRCELQAAAHNSRLQVLACGDAGLWICQIRPGGGIALVAQQDLGGSVTGLFVRNGQLWAEVTTRHAQQLPGLGSAEAPPSAAAGHEAPAPGTSAAAVGPAPAPANPPPPATAPAQPPAAPNPRVPLLPPTSGATAHAPAHPLGLEPATVVRSHDDVLVVDLGQREDVREGDRLAFFGNDPRSPDVVAVGRVTAVDAGHAQVRIGMNEAVPVHGRAAPTDQRETASTIAPPRAAGIWDVAFVARPFIVLDNLGAGLFADARAGYHFRAPIHIEAAIAPIAIATARGGVLAPVGAFVSGSYDARLFEVGLGVGGQTVNDPNFTLDAGSGTTIVQRLRLGARDGAYLEALSYVTLFHSEFTFSSLRLQGQIPVGGHSWLTLAGGGGTLGLGFGEVGLRVMAVGNGGPGSFFLSTVVGGVNVFQSCASCPSRDYVGPMLGAGGEWRL